MQNNKILSAFLFRETSVNEQLTQPQTLVAEVASVAWSSSPFWTKFIISQRPNQNAE